MLIGRTHAPRHESISPVTHLQTAMPARLLALLALAAPAVLADKAWTVDEALVSVEHGPVKARLSAVSTAVAGSVREGAEQQLTAHFRIGAFSDSQIEGEVVLDATASREREGHAILAGTATFQGKQVPVTIPVTLSRMGGQLWLHAVFNLAAPAPLSELRIQLDTGLRPDGTAVASR